MILCIYKIAAVCNGNDLLSSESSEMASTSLCKCMCDSRRKSGDSDLSDKKEGEGCEWAKAVAFYWEEHLHIQLYWELLLHYLRSTSEPLCMCTHCQCMVNLRVCELFISFKSLWVNHTYSFFSYSTLFIYTLNIWSLHHQHLFFLKQCSTSWRRQMCCASQLSKYQQLSQSGHRT